MASFLFLALASLAAAASSTPKRGLCSVPSAQHPSDDAIWTRPGSSLTWYYNYASQPSPSYAAYPQTQFEFVPMMRGVDAANPDGTAFLAEMLALMDDPDPARQRDVNHVLGFDEPDAPTGDGFSAIDPGVAARAWIANFEPLADRGVRLGLPGCTGGPGGLVWLREFLGNCSAMLTERDGGAEEKSCRWDFIPVHWYDNFEGLKIHIDEREAAFPGAEIWVTEYAYAQRSLPEAQAFYNRTAAYLDASPRVARHSYFGAFRSSASDVGADVVLLSDGGEVTDIGAWYTGLGKAEGVRPESTRSGGSRRGGDGGVVGRAWWGVVVAATALAIAV